MWVFLFGMSYSRIFVVFNNSAPWKTLECYIQRQRKRLNCQHLFGDIWVVVHQINFTEEPSKLSECLTTTTTTVIATTAVMQTTFVSIWTRIHVLYGAIEWLQLIVIYSQMLFFLSWVCVCVCAFAVIPIACHCSHSSRIRINVDSVGLKHFCGVEKNFFWCVCVCYAKNAFISNGVVYMWVSVVFAWIHFEQPSHTVSVSTSECEIYWSTNTHLIGAGSNKEKKRSSKRPFVKTNRAVLSNTSSGCVSQCVWMYFFDFIRKSVHHKIPDFMRLMTLCNWLTLFNGTKTHNVQLRRERKKKPSLGLFVWRSIPFWWWLQRKRLNFDSTLKKKKMNWNILPSLCVCVFVCFTL